MSQEHSDTQYSTCNESTECNSTGEWLLNFQDLAEPLYNVCSTEKFRMTREDITWRESLMKEKMQFINYLQSIRNYEPFRPHHVQIEFERIQEENIESHKNYTYYRDQSLLKLVNLQLDAYNYKDLPVITIIDE